MVRKLLLLSLHPALVGPNLELIGVDGIEAVAVYLIDHSHAGDVRGGTRIINLYVLVAAAFTLSGAMPKT